MSAVIEQVQKMQGLGALFAEHGIPEVRVFELPPIPEYAPLGGLGFLVEPEAGVSALEIIRLEEVLESRLGQRVLILTPGEQSWYIPQQLLAKAKQL